MKPAEAEQFPHSITPVARHVPWIITILVLGTGLYLVTLANIGIEAWPDAASYLANGRYMIEHNTFMPMRIAYSTFLNEGTASYGSLHLVYPHHTYSLLIGAVGKLLGEFTLVSGALVSFVMTIVLIIGAYFLMFSLIGNKAMACVFALAVLLNPDVLLVTTYPLTDVILLAFLVLAMLAAVKGKHLLAGIILGMSFLFREHALIIMLFIPLLSPRVTSLRGYIKMGLQLALTFIPFYLATYAIKYFFASESVAAHFYFSAFAKLAATWFTLDALKQFIINCGLFSIRMGLGLLILLVLAVFRRSWFPSIASRMLLMGIAIAVIPCFMLSFKEVPTRYFIYSVPVILAALAVVLARFPRGVWIFAAVVVSSIILNSYIFSRTFTLGHLIDIPNVPQKIIEKIELAKSPYELNDYFASGSVILTNSRMPAYALRDPILVTLPSYTVFKSRPGNEKIDGIIIERQRRGESWPKGKIIIDNYGVTFERLPDFDDYYKYVSGPKE